MQVFDLKRFRRDKNLTQVEVAKIFSCNQNFISNIEAGIKQIPQDKLDILQSKYGDISEYTLQKVHTETINLDSEKKDLLFTGSEAFTFQIVKMMNDKLIAPYSLLEEKDKEIEKLNRKIGKLEEQLAASKKTDVQREGNVICADAV